MANDDQLSFDTDKLGEISFSVKKNEKKLENLQKYFEAKQAEIPLEEIQNNIVNDIH
jgi:hypothetical protein